MLDDSLLPDVHVSLDWATPRRWAPGEAILDSNPAAPALFLVRGGVLRVETAGSDWRVAAGSALLLPGGVRRDRIAAAGGGDGAEWVSLGIRARLYGRLPVDGPFAAPRLWEPASDVRRRLFGWAGQIVEEWSEPAHPTHHATTPPPATRPRDAAGRALADALAKAVFVLCWRESSGGRGAEVPGGAPSWLPVVLRQVAATPETTIPALCEAAGVSPAHLRRIFHRHVGVAPQVYLTDRRLEAARELLRATDLTVAAVAESVGFESAPYFTRLFSARFGAPPARFRADARAPQA